ELPSGQVAFDSTKNIYTAPNGVSWQWYLNGDAIDGAVTQTYTANPDVAGTYSVQVTSAEGCSAIIIGVDESDLAGNVHVFPNPMSNETTVLLPAGVFDITLYDMSGRVVLKRLSCMQREVLHRGSLSAGCYQLHIFNEKGSVVKKLVVE
ncbi:MAG: T9SS type A sorting domain-containing protein, partial [Flavobacteriales bacterium]